MYDREYLEGICKAMNETPGPLSESAKKLDMTDRLLRSIKDNYLFKEAGNWRPVTCLTIEDCPDVIPLHAGVKLGGGYEWTYDGVKDMAQCLNNGWTMAEIAERHKRTVSSVHGAKSNTLREYNGYWSVKPEDEVNKTLRKEMRRLKSRGKLDLMPGVPQAGDIVKIHDDEAEPINGAPEVSEDQKIAEDIDRMLIGYDKKIKELEEEANDLLKKKEECRKLEERRLRLLVDIDCLKESKEVYLKFLANPHVP